VPIDSRDLQSSFNCAGCGKPLRSNTVVAALVASFIGGAPVAVASVAGSATAMVGAGVVSFLLSYAIWRVSLSVKIREGSSEV
jgi:hypothetical protein